MSQLDNKIIQRILEHFNDIQENINRYSPKLLFEQIGPYLEHADDHIRSKGLEILSQISIINPTVIIDRLEKETSPDILKQLIIVIKEDIQNYVAHLEPMFDAIKKNTTMGSLYELKSHFIHIIIKLKELVPDLKRSENLREGLLLHWLLAHMPDFEIKKEVEEEQ